MPTKRQRATRNRVIECTSDEWALMLEQKPVNRFADMAHVSRATWEAHEADVLQEWTRRRPGCRPLLWWKFSAPVEPVEGCKGTEPWAYAAQRQRLGGRGEPLWLFLNLVPVFHRGIPAQWIDRRAAFQDKDRQTIRASVDPSDPPRFESEAAYLARLNLFLEGERARVPKADFEPVTVS